MTSRLPTQDLAALDLGHPFRQPAPRVDTARRDAEQDEIMGAVIALEHLVGDASECTRAMSDASSTGWDRDDPRMAAGGVGHAGGGLLPRLAGRVVKGVECCACGFAVNASVACSVRPGTAPSGFGRTIVAWLVKNMVDRMSHSPYRHGAVIVGGADHPRTLGGADGDD